MATRSIFTTTPLKFFHHFPKESNKLNKLYRWTFTTLLVTYWRRVKSCARLFSSKSHFSNEHLLLSNLKSTAQREKEKLRMNSHHWKKKWNRVTGETHKFYVPTANISKIYTLSKGCNSYMDLRAVRMHVWQYHQIIVESRSLIPSNYKYDIIIIILIIFYLDLMYQK
jgi:hypothetical protein